MSSLDDDTPEFDALLEFLKRNRGFDFTGYKRPTLHRRVQKRLQIAGLDDYGAYLELLERDPDEFTQLFDTLLINVTRFFRDDAAWQLLADEIVPALLDRSGGAPVRIWSAGCASGEEAYSLAMLFAEAMGVDRFRERVKIYATDVDDDALASARSAIYTPKQVEDVPEPLRARYFEALDGKCVVVNDLRRSVIFGRNDLVQDAPISRIDLLACRNTLMYFNPATQATILGKLHFALAEHGVLFLGRAETLLTQSGAFAPIDLKRRLFGRASRFSPRDRAPASSLMASRERIEDPQHRLREAAFEAGGHAQLVVDRSGQLVRYNRRARVLFGLVGGDIGRPLQDLELSHRPVELRSLLERCYADRRPVMALGLMWPPRSDASERWMDLEITPLLEDTGFALGASLVFTDVTIAKRLQMELEESRQSLETAYEELQSTNEELETTNEELQSTVEELETTNEELQSSNEELETMNGELQVTNEELGGTNTELRRRSDELRDLNAFLESVFASLDSGVVVIDRDLRVTVWNARSEELWGVRASEAIAANVLALDIGLPTDQLAGAVRSVLWGQSDRVQVSLSAVSRLGRAMECDVSCAPLRGVDGSVRGVIVMVDEAG